LNCFDIFDDGHEVVTHDDLLVGVMDADVTAHGFEHYLLWDEVELCPRFGYEV